MTNVKESLNSRYRILMVDDEREICRVISTVLKKEGYRINKAYNGGQAIKKIKEKNYNLIILDYKLPDINGIRVVEEVRPTNPTLKVIMISAYGNPLTKSMAKNLGVYRFLEKPFDLNRLVKVVKDALAKNQGEVDRSSTPRRYGISVTPVVAKAESYNTDGTEFRCFRG